MEDSNAKETLLEFPHAAGAYDRVPIASASAVWTLDTSTDIFLLHSIQVGRVTILHCIDSPCPYTHPMEEQLHALWCQASAAGQKTCIISISQGRLLIPDCTLGGYWWRGKGMCQGSCRYIDGHGGLTLPSLDSKNQEETSLLACKKALTPNIPQMQVYCSSVSDAETGTLVKGLKTWAERVGGVGRRSHLEEGRSWAVGACGCRQRARWILEPCVCSWRAATCPPRPSSIATCPRHASLLSLHTVFQSTPRPVSACLQPYTFQEYQ